MVTERKHEYPCATLQQTSASLADLMRRRDQGLVTAEDYYAIRARLIRAGLAQRTAATTALYARVRAVDWKGEWAGAFRPLRDISGEGEI